MPMVWKVPRADGVHLHEDPAGRRGIRPLGEDAAREAAGKRRRLRDRGPLHARQRAGFLDDLVVEHLPALRRIPLTQQVEVHDEDAPGLEPRVDLLCVTQFAEEQPGRDQRHQGKRDLRDDEQLPQRQERADAAMTGRRGDQLVLEHRHDVGLRGLQRRREAEEDAGEDREPRGEGEHARIQRESGAIDRNGSGSLAVTIALSVQEASAMPAIPPRIESSRLSVSSCGQS